MTLFTGARLGPYEILAPLGAGGMGEVYKARDIRLDRVVAIKVLPEDVAADPGRLRRFEQEARAASALNHPNILTVLDVGSDNSIPYIVTELVGGRTLFEVAARGALPVKTILDIATQIADGLACAHEARIVHRDLKPSNIMWTDDGLVKILDFGLAKTSTRAPRLDADSASVTASDSATGEGTLLGTTDYMSPEQASGSEVDFRSDQFALGTILYELETGERPFRRSSTVETLVAIIRDDPIPLESLRPDLPVPLRWITERCLAKRPRDRFASTLDLAQDFAVLRSHLAEVTASGRVREREAKPRSGLRWGALLATTAAAAAIAVFVIVTYRRREDPSVATPSRLSLLPASGTTLTFQGSVSAPVALSPSSKRVVFGARDPAGRDLLWVRSLDALTPVPISGTEGGSYPFWSPDERYIGFFAGGRLRKVPLSGGPPETLCDARDGRGGAWSSAGTILFAPDSAGPIFEVRDTGGEITPVTSEKGDKESFSHRWPSFLPDGDHFFYLVHYLDAARSDGGIYVSSIRTPERRRLLPDISNAAYAKPGYILFVRDDVLMAAPLDPAKLRLTGHPFSLGERVTFHPYRWDGAFSVSGDGVLAYQGSASAEAAQLTWFDRAGKRIETIGEPGDYGGIRLSPDGSLCAAEVRDPGTGKIDIWIFDLARKVASRLTTASTSISPVWSPDGAKVAFSSNRSGHWDLYAMSVADPAAPPEVIFESTAAKTPTDWTREGSMLFNTDATVPANRWEVWILSASRTPIALLKSPFDERDACLSPDGKLLAHVSNESGSEEVYVQTYPRSGWRRRVSTNGGRHPLWRPTGAELFYVGADQKLFAADFRPQAKPQVGLARALMDAPMPPSAADIPLYGVSRDGARLLIVSGRGTSGGSLTLVFDWTTALKK